MKYWYMTTISFWYFAKIHCLIEKKLKEKKSLSFNAISRFDYGNVYILIFIWVLLLCQNKGKWLYWMNMTFRSTRRRRNHGSLFISHKRPLVALLCYWSSSIVFGFQNGSHDKKSLLMLLPLPLHVPHFVTHWNMWLKFIKLI